MSSRRYAGVTMLLVICLGQAPAAAAQARDADGILEEMERVHRSDGLEYVGEVVVTSRNGTERRRSWATYRQGSGNTSNRLIRFLAPADVRGVAFLSLGRASGRPDQWMYLPSMKRERRLAPQDRDAPFVGTDFSYADLDEFDRTNYDAELDGEDVIDGEPCFRIRLVSRERSPFPVRVLLVSKGRFVPRRITYFRDARSEPARQLSFANYQSVDGHIVALRTEMADLARGSRTVVVLTSVRFNRPQPPDRYTLQNLVREMADVPTAAPGVAPPTARDRRLGWPQSDAAQTTRPARAWPGQLSGLVDSHVLVFPSGRPGVDDRVRAGVRVDVRQQIARGRVRAAAAVRAESESDGLLGSLQWDPADRLVERSPLSLRELTLGVTLARAIDLSIGPSEVAWGTTDWHSPAAGFLPRDLSDPLIWEPLPLWGARLTGQRGTVRFDVYKAFTTTPWRIPRLDGRFSPGASADVYFEAATEMPPARGFEMIRVTHIGSGWDATGWVRTGVRPTPVFTLAVDVADLDSTTEPVPMSRRFVSEQAAGMELNKPLGSWLLRVEAAVSHAADAAVGTAGFYTLQAEHAWRAGTITWQYAGRIPEASYGPATPIDRADLPSVMLTLMQPERWGDWRASWLGTLDNAGGAFSGEISRPVNDDVRWIVGLDIPHGSRLSTVGAFAAARRLRTSLQVRW